MILIEQYDVLEAPIQQDFDKCKGEGATLYVKRVDVVAFIFVRLARKRAEVRCNATGKNIPKRHWNEETQKEAKELLVQHKTPVWGYYVFGGIILALIFSAAYFLYQDSVSRERYQNSFIAKSSQERKAIISKLGAGDFVEILGKVYKIESIDDKTVALIESDVPKDYVDNINPDLHPDSSFKKTFKLKKEDFVNENIKLSPNSSALISDVLDR